MDWLKGKSAGNHGFSHDIWWVSCNLSLNQSIFHHSSAFAGWWRGVLLELQRLLPGLWGGLSGEATQCSTGGGPVGICGGCWCLEDSWSADMAMDQYLLIPFLMWWTSINPSYFDVHQGYKVLTHCHICKSWLQKGCWTLDNDLTWRETRLMWVKHGKTIINHPVGNGLYHL